jgi:hypothetical protein
MIDVITAVFLQREFLLWQTCVFRYSRRTLIDAH